MEISCVCGEPCCELSELYRTLDRLMRLKPRPVSHQLNCVMVALIIQTDPGSINHLVARDFQDLLKWEDTDLHVADALERLYQQMGNDVPCRSMHVRISPSRTRIIEVVEKHGGKAQPEAYRDPKSDTIVLCLYCVPNAQDWAILSH